jgi:hypothetical protein
MAIFRLLNFPLYDENFWPRKESSLFVQIHWLEIAKVVLTLKDEVQHP